MYTYKHAYDPLFRNCDLGVYNNNTITPKNLLGYYTAACKITRKDSNDPAPSILHVYYIVYIYIIHVYSFSFLFLFFIFSLLLRYSFFLYLANLPYKTSERNDFMRCKKTYVLLLLLLLGMRVYTIRYIRVKQKDRNFLFISTSPTRRRRQSTTINLRHFNVYPRIIVWLQPYVIQCSKYNEINIIYVTITTKTEIHTEHCIASRNGLVFDFFVHYSRLTENCTKRMRTAV